jgi:hypothetical protein
LPKIPNSQCHLQPCHGYNIYVVYFFGSWVRVLLILDQKSYYDRSSLWCGLYCHEIVSLLSWERGNDRTRAYPSSIQPKTLDPPFRFVCWFVSNDLKHTYSWSLKLLFQCQIGVEKERSCCILFQSFYVGCMEGMLLYTVTPSL